MRIYNRINFSKVAIEKALYDLSVWYDQADRPHIHVQDKLYLKTMGIVSHDRKLNYLH